MRITLIDEPEFHGKEAINMFVVKNLVMNIEGASIVITADIAGNKEEAEDFIKKLTLGGIPEPYKQYIKGVPR